ncbi:MAG: sigma-54-dependent Fis family transcriptional regulator [Firmicutes bacterium HGW-Firmicutes-14]|nr:MAG: sigma-54-dependent Fis family transcriptional regulator [Firmicutes bacterium HGW-Firmicutes-14]
MNRADNEVLEQQIEKLKMENQLLKTIIDSIHESVFATNKAGKVILYNYETEKIEGIKREDVLGKKEADLYTGHSFSKDVTNKVLKTGKPIKEQHYKYDLPIGRKTSIIFSSYPFYYKGQIAAVYTIARNINQISNFITTTLETQKKYILEEKNDQTGAVYHLDDIIGVNIKLRNTISLARRVAGNGSPILIVGETGTGKELFAHGIHIASLYSKGPFVPVNCAAIPDTLLESTLFGTMKGAFTGAVDLPGLFEQAEDGTVFLDEINSMPSLLQTKLLRVLQEKTVRRIGSKAEIPVNCRIISATNVDPFAAVNENSIRKDLFFRLATVILNIQPLRERKEDIEILAMHFIKKFNNKFGLFVNDISSEVIDVFQGYHWPGNVRELENVIESSMNLVEIDNTILKLHHLPECYSERLLKRKQDFQTKTSDKSNIRDALSEFEKKAIEDTLQKYNGNVSKTAQELGISRQNLHYKIRTFGIKNNAASGGLHNFV